ncbi:MAG: S-layer homology domain-containing protein, partial [Firmicutes bacterium]|nr:S-layer homology domain-containing protein [Bacillota bacterium]
MIKIKRFIGFLLTAVLMFSITAEAYNVVDLPESMTLDEAMGIFDASSITRATISNYNDRKYIELTEEQISEIYENIKSMAVYREENPVPFRGTALNLYTDSGVKSYYVSSGFVLGKYGSSNYICYDAEGDDAVYMTNIETMYQESEEKIGSDDIPRMSTYDFLNLPDEQWGHTPAAEAAANNLLPYSFTTKYTDNISREEFCLLLERVLCNVGNYASAADYAADKGIVYVSGAFSDCDSDVVDALYALGIVSGKSETEFDPGGTISREEAAAMLTRAADQFMYIETWGSLDYADNDYISSWAEPFVLWVTNQSIMNGTDGMFSPQSSISVLQAVTSVNRTYKVINKNINFYRAEYC